MCKRCSGIEVHLLHLILRGQDTILHNQGVIMADISGVEQEVANLKTQVQDLQTAIDTDQGSDAQVVADLQAANDAQAVEIQRLTDLLGTSPTDEQLQGVIDGLKAVGVSVAAATADVGGPNA